MSVNEFQACLARVYVDETFRALLYANPAGALDGYRLTQAERDALSRLDRRLLDVFTDSLRRKRMKRVEVSFPLLFLLWRDEIEWYYRRYFTLYPIHEHQPGHRDVLDFGRFIEETLVGSETLPSYASDVARYERYYFQVSLDVPVTAPPDAALSMDRSPRLGAGVHVVDFEHDVVEIERAARAGDAESLARDEVSPVTILFMAGSTPEQPRLLRINRETRIILECADGRTALRDVIARVQRCLHVEGVEDQVLAAIERLFAAGALVAGEAPALPSVAPRRVRPLPMSEAFDAGT